MPAVLCFHLGFFLSYMHVAVSLLEQDGSKEHLEEKEVKALSCYWNVFPINTAKSSNTQPLAPYFQNLVIFLWSFEVCYCGKDKTEDLILPLVQHVVKSAVLVYVCDPRPASARLHLLDKPPFHTNDRQIQPADTVRRIEHCTEV